MTDLGFQIARAINNFRPGAFRRRLLQDRGTSSPPSRPVLQKLVCFCRGAMDTPANKEGKTDAAAPASQRTAKPIDSDSRVFHCVRRPRTLAYDVTPHHHRDFRRAGK